MHTGTANNSANSVTYTELIMKGLNPKRSFAGFHILPVIMLHNEDVSHIGSDRMMSPSSMSIGISIINKSQNRIHPELILSIILIVEECCIVLLELL